MSYAKKVIRKTKQGQRLVVYQALGGASDCGADQEWDPSCNFAGQQGQCVPKGMVGKAPGCDYSQSLSSGGGSSSLTSLAQGAGAFIWGIIGKPSSPSAPVVVQGGGMSTGTVVAIGAGVLGLALLLRSRS